MEANTGKQAAPRGLEALEAGQVAELRVNGGSASYWTYIRGVSGGAVSVWVPEINGEPVKMEAGAPVEIKVTLAGSEILVTSGAVSGTGAETRPYAELELDPACARLEHRRRYLRVAAVVPVSLRRLPDGLTPWGEAVKAKTVSLSPGGLSLESEGEFLGGEQLAVELHLPGGTAEAVAVVLESSGPGVKPARITVSFTYISDCSEAAITRLIYHYQRMHGAARA